MLITRVKWRSGHVSRENLDIMRQEVSRLIKITRLCESLDSLRHFKQGCTEARGII